MGDEEVALGGVLHDVGADLGAPLEELLTALGLEDRVVGTKCSVGGSYEPLGIGWSICPTTASF